MKSPRPAAPRLQVSTVEEALDVIPHLLGYHPAESLVTLVIRYGVVEVTARAELAANSAPGGLEGLLRKVWRRFPGSDAWLVVYTGDARAGWDVLARCDRALPPGVGRRLTLVDGVHWQEGSPDGPAGEYHPGHGPVAAAAAFHGLPARACRAELEACFDGPGERAAEAMIARLDAAAVSLGELRKSQWPGRMAREVLGYLDTGELDDAAAARLTLLCCHRASRDAALLLVSRFDARRHVALWQAVINRVPEPYTGNAVALAGMAAWIAGDGALASICLDRLARVPADAELPRVLGWLTNEVLPPSVWDGMRAELLKATTATVRKAVSRPAYRRGR